MCLKSEHQIPKTPQNQPQRPLPTANCQPGTQPAIQHTMQLTIEFKNNNLDNETLTSEISRTLKRISDTIEEDIEYYQSAEIVINDIGGNAIGFYRFNINE